MLGADTPSIPQPAAPIQSTPTDSDSSNGAQQHSDSEETEQREHKEQDCEGGRGSEWNTVRRV